MNEFLNPKSMSTPGAAGALMMLIANALCNNFPEFPFRYVALILSFAIGAIVFSATTMKIWERGIFWVVNSLIIFSMGVGASNIAANVASKQLAREENSTSVKITSLVSSVLLASVGSAFAQDSKNPPAQPREPNYSAPSSSDTAQARLLSKDEMATLITSLQKQISELQAENQRLRLQVPDRQSRSETQPQSRPLVQPQAQNSSSEATSVKTFSREGFFNKW